MRRSSSAQHLAAAGSMLKRSISKDGLSKLGKGTVRYLTSGPSQNAGLRAAGVDPGERGLGVVLVTLAAIVLVTTVLITTLTETDLQGVFSMYYDVATLWRHPMSAQDNWGSLVIVVICLGPLAAIDYGVCRRIMPNAGARWFLLHAIGNLVVAVWTLPDFYHTYRDPTAALSVTKCRALSHEGYLACSEWPVGLIMAMHVCKCARA